jgi:hypothetical protein
MLLLAVKGTFRRLEGAQSGQQEVLFIVEDRLAVDCIA